MKYRILFLDFDGVLNNDESKEIEIVQEWDGKKWGADWIREHLVERLNEIIEATDALVVISSTWRRYWTKKQLQRILDERGFRGQVVGITPVIAEGPNARPLSYGHKTTKWPDRSNEVTEWIYAFTREFDLESHVVLDDRADLFQNESTNFVNTNSRIGITDEDVQAAIQFLTGDNPQ